MKLIIKNDYEAMCAWAAEHIADAINNHKESRPFQHVYLITTYLLFCLFLSTTFHTW